MANPINCRTLGRTGLSVSALGLGTVELGLDYGIRAPGKYRCVQEADAIRVVHAALDSGINLIDTARAYGASERVVGSALRGRRNRVVLATKVRTQTDTDTVLCGADLRRFLLETLETSLRHLETDYVDIWQIHNVDEALLDSIDDVAEAFDEARRSGKVRSVGGSIYGETLPFRALETGIFDMVQVPYSVFDQRLADRFFPRAAEQNVGIVSRSVLLKGALTEKAEHLPDRLHALRIRSREFRQLVAEANAGLSPPQAAVAFALAEPHISAVLVGVRSEAELEENLRALSCPLSTELTNTLHTLRLDDAQLLHPGTWGID